MNDQRGSAITETLIGMLVLLPAFWAVDYLGRLQDINRSTIMAARYAAWEELTHLASDRALGSTISKRIYKGDLHRFEPPNETPAENKLSNPLWRYRNGQLLIEKTPTDFTKYPATDDEDLPNTGLIIETVAHGDRLPRPIRILGLSEKMLDLSKAGLAISEVKISVKASLEPSQATNNSIIFDTKATLSSGDWSAFSDQEYQQRIDAMVASEPVDTLSLPAQTLGRFFVFEEGRYARATDFIPPSRLLPLR